MQVFPLQINVKHGSNHQDLFKKYQIEIVEEKGDGHFIIEMLDRGSMFSPDLEDLQSEDIVLKLMWEDGSEVHPRG